MISDKDIVFLKQTGEEIDFSPNKIVHLGWYGSGALSILEYAQSYLHSAIVLFEEFKKSEGDYAKLDSLGIPIVFLYRHYCELIIKYLYIKYVRKVKEFTTEEDYSNDIKDLLNKGHRITDLWNCTSPIISKLRTKVESTVSLEALGSYFKQISDFDHDSMLMRYPINKELAPLLSGDIKIDIFNLNEKMTHLAEAIQILDGEIDNQIVQNAPISELDNCFQIIKKNSDIYERYISLISDNIEDDNEDDMGHSPFDFLEPNSKFKEDYRKKEEIIKELPDDGLLILEALYYVGRNIRQDLINLPKCRDEAMYNILTALLEFIKQEGYNLGEPISNRDRIDFWNSKSNYSQLLYIRHHITLYQNILNATT